MIKEDILRYFERTMVEAVTMVYHESLSLNVDMRTASYALAMKRILNAERVRGRSRSTYKKKTSEKEDF